MRRLLFAAGLLAPTLPACSPQEPARTSVAVVDIAPPKPEDPPAVPALPGEVKVVEITAGAEFTCARTEAREVYCWGQNTQGQIGDGTTTRRIQPVRVAVSDAVEIGAGNFHGCARHGDGRVSCWGSRVAGQVGDGEAGDLPPVTPAHVEGLEHAVSLAVGARTTCAVRADHQTLCWGSMFGFSPGPSRREPFIAASATLVPGLAGATRIDMGPDHGCGLWGQGEVRCWAGESPFQLVGIPGVYQQPNPVPVFGMPRARSLAAGGYRSCAVAESGSLHCWGDTMAVGNRTFSGAVAEKVASPTDFTRVDVEIHHTCAIRADKTVWCFGSDNKDGRLGDGTHAASLVPRLVIGVDDAVQVAVGEHHSCALTGKGELYCWGGNEEGQLGDGTTQDRPTAIRIRWERSGVTPRRGESPFDPRSAAL